MDKMILILVLLLGATSGQMNEGMNIPYAQRPAFSNAQAGTFQSGPVQNDNFNRRAMDYGLTSGLINDGGGQFSAPNGGQGAQRFGNQAFGANNGFSNGGQSGAFNNNGGQAFSAANGFSNGGQSSGFNNNGGQAFAAANGANNGFSNGGQSSAFNSNGGQAFAAANGFSNGGQPGAMNSNGGQSFAAANGFSNGGPASGLNNGGGFGAAGPQAPDYEGSSNPGAFSGGGQGGGSGSGQGPSPSVDMNYGNWRDRARGPLLPQQPGYQQSDVPAGPNYDQPPNAPAGPNYGQPPNAPAGPNYGQPPNRPMWDWRDRVRGPFPPQQPGYQQPDAPPAGPNYDQPPNAPAGPNYGQPPKEPMWNWRDRVRGPLPPQQPDYQQPNAPAGPNSGQPPSPINGQQPNGGGAQPGQSSNAPNGRPLPESILKLRRFLNRGPSVNVTTPPPDSGKPALTPNPSPANQNSTQKPGADDGDMATTQTSGGTTFGSSTSSTTSSPIDTSSVTTDGSTSSSVSTVSSTTPICTTAIPTTTAKPTKKRKNRRPKLGGVLSDLKEKLRKAGSSSGKQCDCQEDSKKKKPKKGKSEESEFEKILSENGKSREGLDDELRDFGF